MNLKKLIVYDYDIFFNILDEIKEYLNFEPIKVEKNYLEKKIKEINSDFLVISRDKKKKHKNHIILEGLPLKLEKIVQIINLNFLKNKFIYQSHISIGQYKLNINSREISKDENKLDLTEREINLIIYLNNSRSAVKIDKLQKEVWTYNSSLETHTVETHIYRLRKKIKDRFKDDNFIISSKEGYLIN